LTDADYYQLGIMGP